MKKKIRSKCFTFTHICPSFVNFSASKYRTSKGTLHQNYTSKHQNHFLKVNMRSFAIKSNAKCQSTIQTWMFTSENAIEVVECSLVNCLVGCMLFRCINSSNFSLRQNKRFKCFIPWSELLTNPSPTSILETPLFRGNLAWSRGCPLNSGSFVSLLLYIARFQVIFPVTEQIMINDNVQPVPKSFTRELGTPQKSAWKLWSKRKQENKDESVTRCCVLWLAI